MTFATILDRAITTAALLGAEAQCAELEDVAHLARTYADRSPSQHASQCPLAGALEMIQDATAASTQPLVDTVRDSFEHLGWFRNAKVPSDFVSQSAAAELIGPDGGIPSDELRFGLFLIGPGADYQRHWHVAEEHYMVLSGNAEWNLGRGWQTYDAGAVIPIHSMTPHAIRTGADPVLTLYSWTGDVTFDTYETGD